MLTLLRLPFLTGLGASEWPALRSGRYAHLLKHSDAPTAKLRHNAGAFERSDVMLHWAIFLVAALCVGTAQAQTCEETCNEYKSFARRAGDPNTLEPLLKLYRACMECAKGPGGMNCTPLSDPDHQGMRCDYNAPPPPAPPSRE